MVGKAGEKTFKLRGLTGMQSFNYQQGIHTIIIDARQQQLNGILDLLKAYVKEYPNDSDKLIGMALGFYKIPLNDFYPEIEDFTKLNDKSLAEAFKWANKEPSDILKTEKVED